MKNIFSAPFVVDMGKTTANMYRLGWDERNGGNISYLLDEREVAKYLDVHTVLRDQSRRDPHQGGRHDRPAPLGV